MTAVALAVAQVGLAENGPSQNASSQRSGERGKPVELWRAFPLGTTRLAPATPPVAVAQAPVVATSGPVGAQLVTRDGLSAGLPNPLWYVLVGLAAGLACGGAALVVMPRLRGRGEPARAHVATSRRARTRPSRQAEDMSADLVARVAAYHAPNAVAAAVTVDSASGVATLEQGASSEPVPSDVPLQLPDTDEPEPPGHVLLAPAPQGYELFEVGGDAPTPGETLDGNELGLDGHFTVVSVGPSPLDDDPRECAVLVRVP